MPQAIRWIVGGVLAVVSVPAAALAQHSCDELGDKDWRTVATVETVASSDSAPFKAGQAVKEAAGGSWYVDRSITELPFCHYFNAVGNYSLRSYSLSPQTRNERVEICRTSSSGGVESVAPYAGKCPPG